MLCSFSASGPQRPPRADRLPNQQREDVIKAEGRRRDRGSCGASHPRSRRSVPHLAVCL